MTTCTIGEVLEQLAGLGATATDLEERFTQVHPDHYRLYSPDRVVRRDWLCAQLALPDGYSVYLLSLGEHVELWEVLLYWQSRRGQKLIADHFIDEASHPAVVAWLNMYAWQDAIPL